MASKAQDLAGRVTTQPKLVALQGLVLACIQMTVAVLVQRTVMTCRAMQV